LQVSISVFSGTVENFSGKDGSAPVEKIGPYAQVSKSVWSVRVPISTVHAVTLTWVFQRSHDNLTVAGDSLSTDFARIYLINVTNTLQGGAASCRRCPRGIKQDRSVTRSVSVFSLYVIVVSV